MAEEKIWKPLDLVRVSAEYLGSKDVPNPRLDAELLLCEIMGLKRRVDLYAGFEREISGKELAAYRELIRRRAAREPVSRILGRREFMGIGFAVTPDVLSPRPETELLVELLLEAVRPKKLLPEETPEEPAAEVVMDEPAETEAMTAELQQLLDSYAEDVDDDAPPEQETPVQALPGRDAAPVRPAPAPAAVKAREKRNADGDAGRGLRILDLGTGSGCIAVAVAAHLPGAMVTAVDASPRALAVARKNAEKAGVAERIDFRQGDWFAGCRKGTLFDVVLSNPPYLVEGDEEIWPEVSGYDPAGALYGGSDGLDCYRRIIPAAGEWLAPGGLILLEVGAGQAARVAGMLRGRDFVQVDSVRDYGGVERVVRARAQ